MVLRMPACYCELSPKAAPSKRRDFADLAFRPSARYPVVGRDPGSIRSLQTPVGPTSGLPTIR